MLKFTNRVIAQDVEIGALDQLYAATDPKAESGQFTGPDGPGESKGYPTIVQPAESAKDPDIGRRLWRMSEELTGVHFDVPMAA